MQLLGALVCAIIAIQLNCVASFWLTDSTLFEPPSIQQNSPPIIKTKDEPGEALEASTPNSVSKNEWLRVEPAKQLQPQVPLGQQQSEECRCSADWLQNQTGHLINKWLNSADVVSQMRLLMSNSTGASNNNMSALRIRAGELSQNEPPVTSAGGTAAATNHWLAWTRKTGNGNNNNGNSYATNSNGAHSRATSAAQGESRHKQRHAQAKVRQVQQGERGAIGPKGEQGARGERGERGAPGESGLITVKDRDGLFDLPAETESGEQRQTGKRRQLVFIEAEQMLVVSTETGWRPLQLLSPIRDFRKIVSKFALSSSEERRKLLMAPSGVDDILDNSIRPLRRLSGDASASRVFVVGKNGNNDDHDDDDDDDLFDAGSENDLEDDEDDEDDDDDDADDDDDDEDQADSGGQVEPIKAKHSSPGKQPKETGKLAPVSARSAAANVARLVSMPIDNLIGAPMTEAVVVARQTGASKIGQLNSAAEQLGRLKLRLIALNEPFSGNVHGIRGADFECKRNAARANIKGSFRAFLASGIQNLNEVVRPNAHKYAIVNLRNEVLASSWNDMFKPTTTVQQRMPLNPLSRLYSFDGRHVASDSNWPNKLVWHGANSKAGYRDPKNNCDGWHSDSLNKFGYATPLHLPRNSTLANKRRQKRRHLADRDLSDQFQSIHKPAGELVGSISVLEAIEKYPCRMPLIVLCIETVGQY